MAKEDTQKKNQQDQPVDEGQENMAPAAPKSPEENKEAIWQKIESVYNAAKEAYLQGTSLEDVLNSFIATVQEIKDTETQNLGGLGTEGPRANLVGTESQDEVPE